MQHVCFFGLYADLPKWGEWLICLVLDVRPFPTPEQTQMATRVVANHRYRLALLVCSVQS